MSYNFKPTTRNELKELVVRLISERGNNADLNDIDTSEITDMSFLFYDTTFNGNISGWDVSKVVYMNSMFEESDFNGDISNWNVSNVEDMSYMFSYSCFDKDISKWVVSEIAYMNSMFADFLVTRNRSEYNINSDNVTIDYIFNISLLKKNPPKWYTI